MLKNFLFHCRNEKGKPNRSVPENNPEIFSLFRTLSSQFDLGSEVSLFFSWTVLFHFSFHTSVDIRQLSSNTGQCYATRVILLMAARQKKNTRIICIEIVVVEHDSILAYSCLSWNICVFFLVALITDNWKEQNFKQTPQIVLAQGI